MFEEILTVNAFLATLRVAEPQSHKNLTIMPLMSDRTKDLRLKTLEEAIDTGDIDISEIDGGGSVPKLKIANKGDVAVLILQGSIIKANLQDRAIKHNIIVFPHTVIEGDVFCIESQRWRPSNRKAYKSKSHLSSDIRMNFSKEDQSSVWRKIEEKRQRMGVRGETNSADYIYEAYQKELEEYKGAFVMKPEYSGIIGLIEGRPISISISGVKGIFNRQFGDLLSSLAIDALDKIYCEEIRQHHPLTVEQFLSEVVGSGKAEHDAIGGRGIEFKGDKVLGGCLINNETVIQLEAFMQVA